jgi:TPR repeat protein
MTENEIDLIFDGARKATEKGDHKKALRLLRPLAKQGDSIAQYMVGRMYADGLGVSRDYKQAAKLFGRILDTIFLCEECQDNHPSVDDAA